MAWTTPQQAFLQQLAAAAAKKRGRKPQPIAAYERAPADAVPTFTTEGDYQDAARTNAPYAKPSKGPDPYQTLLAPHQEQQFRQWVKANKIPFDPNAGKVDYDMRGYWLARQKGGSSARAANGHFPDTFKTPYDTSFSAESKYATANNPRDWQGERLVDASTGQTIFGPPTKLVAPGTTAPGDGMTEAQRATMLRYLYEHQGLDLGVPALNRLNKRDIEQNAKDVALGRKPAHKLDSAEQAAKLAANSGIAKGASAIVAPLNPSLPASERVQTPWLNSSPVQGAGLFGGGQAILGNLLKDAARNTLGFPASIVELATHPVPTVKAFGESYKQAYAPLATGDFGQFLHLVGQNPLNYGLDVGAGLGIAGKLGRLDKVVPAERKLPLDGGAVQPHASPNPVARLVQHATDRWSAAHPDAPWMGARARVSRRLPFEQERDFERANAALLPFAQARRGLSGPEETAFDVLYGYGDQNAARGLEAEIQTRVDRLKSGAQPIPRGRNADGQLLYQLRGDPRRTTVDPAEAEPSMTPTEREAQEAQVKALIAARPIVQNPSPKLLAALEEGRKLGDLETQQRIDAGVLKPADAEAHAQMRARMVTGGRFVESPAPSKRLTQVRADTARAEQAYERAVQLRDREAQKLVEKGGEQAATVEQRIAAGAAERPRTREEAQARLQQLEAEHEKALSTVEAGLMRRPMTPEEAQTHIDQIDAKLASARAADLKKVVRNLETERARYVKAKSAGYYQVPFDKVETARRNLLRHAGMPTPTLRDELRQHVEDSLARLAQTHPDEPSVAAHVARQQEIADLRGALEASHPVFGHGGAADLGTITDPRTLTRLQQAVEQARRSQLGGKVVGEGKLLTPRGGVLVEKRGAHLSELRTVLQRLETAAERRYGVVPGAKGGRELVGGQTFEGARSLPDVAATTKLQGVIRRARTVTGRAQSPVKHSEGILFEQGRSRRGSQVLLEHAQRGNRYRQQLADIKRAESFSIPFDESLLHEVDQRGERRYAIFNPQGTKLPRRLNEATAAELEQMTPREYQEAAHQDGIHLAQDVFPSENELRQLPDAQRAKLRLVDAKVKNALEQSLVPAGDTTKIGKFFDTTNNLSKTALIYLSLPKYVATNLAGNVGFLALKAGVFAPWELVKSAGIMSDLRPETLRRIDVEVGSGTAHALAGPGRGITGTVTHGLANVAGKLADTLPRRAAWLHEAAKRGYKTDAEITDLLHDPGKRHELNQISETAEESMVKFRGLNQAEKKIITRAIFIYPWMKGATRYGYTLARDQPVTADIVSHAGQVGADDAEKILGRIASYLDGIIPIGKPHSKLGTVVERVVNPAALTPIGTAGQAAEVAGNVLGLAPQRQDLQLAQYLTPGAKALVEGVTHTNTFTGNAYPQSMTPLEVAGESIVGTPEQPAIPLLSAIKTAFQKPQTAPFTGPADKQRNYVQEGGWKAALKMALIGGVRERDLNLTAAQAKGRDEELAAMNPVDRAVARASDDQKQLVASAIKAGVITAKSDIPGLEQAFVEEQQRDAMYAQAAKSAGVPSNRLGNLGRLQADMAYAVQQKLLDPETAAGVVQAARTLTPNQLKSLRGRVDSHIYPSQLILARLRELVRKAGGKA